MAARVVKREYLLRVVVDLPAYSNRTSIRVVASVLVDSSVDEPLFKDPFRGQVSRGVL